MYISQQLDTTHFFKYESKAYINTIYSTYDASRK